jgi:hypothetical protein
MTAIIPAYVRHNFSKEAVGRCRLCGRAQGKEYINQCIDGRECEAYREFYGIQYPVYRYANKRISEGQLKLIKKLAGSRVDYEEGCQQIAGCDVLDLTTFAAMRYIDWLKSLV